MSANVGFLWVQLVIRLFLPIVIGIVTSSAGQLPSIEAKPEPHGSGLSPRRRPILDLSSRDCRLREGCETY